MENYIRRNVKMPGTDYYHTHYSSMMMKMMVQDSMIYIIQRKSFNFRSIEVRKNLNIDIEEYDIIEVFECNKEAPIIN